MKRCELLSPVGNLETLYYAISAKANSVYLAGKQFGARAFAKNFTEEELKQAITFAHLYNVKVFVTVNTIIYEREIPSLIDYVKILHEHNVDALIVQDLGVINLLRKTFPNLEIHASTQCHIHNQLVVDALEQLGVKRVVFARELDIDTINNINTPLEKEVFIHGALCVCYSGCCLFSSLNGGRSANRGLCVGSCRLPYKLIENNEVINTKGNFLLSTKELNTINNINKLLDSKIDCFKIEGRMKSPEYVYYVTSLYRKAIDAYYNNEEYKITQEDLTTIETLYNRKFTNGYLFKDEIANILTSNHIGSYLGKVISVNDKKIKIKLDNNIYQEDGIRFYNQNKGMILNKIYNEKGLLISNANKNEIIYVDNKISLKEEDIVYKTNSNKLSKDIEVTNLPKISLDIKVVAKLNQKLYIKFKSNETEVEIEKDIVEPSLNKPTTKEDIISKLSKLGNTVYKLRNIDITIDDNIFISLSELNNTRRQLIEKLNEKRLQPKNKIIINPLNILEFTNYKPSKININTLVRTEQQLQSCLDNNIDNIYVTDYNLYEKYKNTNIYYQTARVNPNLNLSSDINILSTELSSIYKYSKTNQVVTDYYLNVVNNYTIDYLNTLGVNRICLSLELTDEDLKELNHHNTELFIYGRPSLMITKYCILRDTLKTCRKNTNNNYYLEDRFSNRYPIICNNCLTTIMDSKLIDKISNINYYINIGISNYKIELFDEDYNTTTNIINNIKKSINLNNNDV